MYLARPPPHVSLFQLDNNHEFYVPTTTTRIATSRTINLTHSHRPGCNLRPAKDRNVQTARSGWYLAILGYLPFLRFFVASN